MQIREREKERKRKEECKRKVEEKRGREEKKEEEAEEEEEEEKVTEAQDETLVAFFSRVILQSHSFSHFEYYVFVRMVLVK